MRNVMLHIFNMFWLGGVPSFVRDVMRAYPQFHHVVAYLWERAAFGTEDYDMMQEWEWELGCDIGHVDGSRLCPELFEEIQPTITIINGIGRRSMVGKPPYKWLWKWPRIFIHHMPSGPLIPAHLHVFVSEFMKTKYVNDIGGMRDWLVCPPVIRTEDYTSIPRSAGNKRCVIGKVSSDWQPRKYPAFYIDVIKELTKKYPDISFEVVGGEKHYGKFAIERLSTPAVQSKPVASFLSGYDIFCYAIAPEQTETWCRAVSEAMAAGLPVVAPPAGAVQEQIVEGKTGFVCHTPEQYIKKLSLLIENPQLRYTMGMAGRQRAHAEFGFDRLHRALDPTIIGVLAGKI